MKVLSLRLHEADAEIFCCADVVSIRAVAHKVDITALFVDLRLSVEVPGIVL